MKKTFSLLVFLISVAVQLQAQSKQPKSLGLPGDNLNLYAALKVFQESKTLEEFEKIINDPNQKINNLDLDGDDQIDYITVVDKVKDDVHSITLRVDMNSREQQDIAVFVVTKEANNRVYIQVVGDEDLYGKDYIIEPNYASEGTPNPGFRSDFDDEYTPAQRRTVSYVEVATWPIVQYIYVPTYRPWVSIWGWNNYPSWWRPWRPYSWHWYSGYHYNYFNIYFGYYSRSSFYRNSNWYNWHYGNNGWRSRSVVYINRYQQGYFRNTYNRPSYNNQRPNSRPSINDRTRPYTRPDRQRPEVRPNPPQRTVPEARPGNSGRGNRNGTGTTRNND